MVGSGRSIFEHDEAAINIVTYMLEAIKADAKTISAISDDTDVFTLLVYWTWKTLSGKGAKVYMR